MKKFLLATMLLLLTQVAWSQNGIKFEQISSDAVTEICNNCDDADTRLDMPSIIPGTNTLCWDICCFNRCTSHFIYLFIF